MYGKYYFKKYWIWIEFRYLCCICHQKIFVLYPKSGNSVSYEIEKKYESKLFKIPKCFKEDNEYGDLKDCIEGLNITGYFLKKEL